MHGHGKTRCEHLCGAVLHLSKIKALHLLGCKEKEKPRQRGRGGMESGSALLSPCVIVGRGHNRIAAADLYNDTIAGAGFACIVTGGIQSGHGVKSLIATSHNISPPYLDALNSAEKNQKKNRTQEKIIL